MREEIFTFLKINVFKYYSSQLFNLTVLKFNFPVRFCFSILINQIYEKWTEL